MREGPNRETRDDTTPEQVALAGCTGLQGSAKEEKDQVEHDAAPSAVLVAERSVDKRARPGGEEEGRDEPTLCSREYSVSKLLL